jgi:hypothetical protein
MPPKVGLALPDVSTLAERKCKAVSKDNISTSSDKRTSIFSGDDGTVGHLRYDAGHAACTIIDNDGKASYTFDNEKTTDATFMQKWFAKINSWTI